MLDGLKTAKILIADQQLLTHNVLAFSTKWSDMALRISYSQQDLCGSGMPVQMHVAKIGVPAHYIKPGITKRLFIQAVVFTGMFIVGEL